MNIKNMQYINYTLKHRKCFLEIEKKLIGRNSIRGYLHDIDKLILYPLFSKKTVHNFHVKFSKHHSKAKNKKDYIQMIIDWECARYTKPDKPLNARQTLYKFYPYLIDKISPLLDDLNL